jgi:hypothetical protein
VKSNFIRFFNSFIDLLDSSKSMNELKLDKLEFERRWDLFLFVQ